MKTRSPGKLWWAVTWLLQLALRRDRVSGARITPRPVLSLGKGYGAWPTPAAVVRPDAVVYSVGVGTDATFDEALLDAGVREIHAFDPTPRAITFAEALQTRRPAFRFSPVGLWKEDTTLTFHAPENPNHVSHSVTALHGERPGFTAPCRRLVTLMRERGHTRIDLLKIDIEGAEYAVLADILASRADVTAICVEFDETHTPVDAGWRGRIGAAVASLRAAGYALVAVRPKGNYVFLRSA
jgi:FkbM family methyltransferase